MNPPPYIIVIDNERGWVVHRNARGESFTDGGSRYMRGGATFAEAARRLNRRAAVLVWRTLEGVMRPDEERPL